MKAEILFNSTVSILAKKVIEKGRRAEILSHLLYFTALVQNIGTGEGEGQGRGKEYTYNYSTW